MSIIKDVATRIQAASGKKWSGKVTEQVKKNEEAGGWTPPEGFFSKSASAIAQGLKRNSDSHKQASSRLSFYRNRAGKNLSEADKQRLEDASEKLRQLYDNDPGAKTVAENKATASVERMPKSTMVMITARLLASAEPVKAAIMPKDKYDWFTFTGNRLGMKTSRGEVTLNKGDVFGVRPSTNGKEIRMVFDRDGFGLNKVMTISPETAQTIAKKVKPRK